MVRRLRGAGERGFSTVVVMGTLLVGGLLVIAAFGATQPGIGMSGEDRDRKLAFAAAEAGLAYYQYHLDSDVNYWTYCTNVAAPSPSEPSPVNNRWADNAVGADPRQWRAVTDSPAQYTIELLPTSGACSATSMLDPNTGTFRVRATGRAGDEKRSIVATFRRRGFLDYIYFTDYETLDPFAYSTQALRNSASTQCPRYVRAGRPVNGGSYCVPIQFADDDHVRGPFHTNDEIRTCNTPTFGRDSADRIEISAPEARAFLPVCTAGVTPDFQGTFVPSATPIGVPPTNSGLKQIAAADYRYTGKTEIVIDGNSMTVTNPAFATPKVQPLPANGVVYVSSSGCTSSYAYAQTYNTTATGCGDLLVKGNYSGSLTMAAENDIIVNGNLTKSGDALLGLIANNFVRVYHPGTFSNGSCTANAATTPTNITIDAAILALQHSFIVDNWYCGAGLGTLKVTGAIAQRFRGPVGTSGGTGYIKDYIYDDRLRHREPPYFIDPVQAAWRMTRQNEQVPAR
jgi:hypothetical protein